jgi:Zinc knuckle
MDIDVPVFTQVQRVTDNDKRRYQNEGRCFKCGQQGHMVKYCPKRKNQGFKPQHQRPSYTQPRTLNGQHQKKVYHKPKQTQGFRKCHNPALKYIQNIRAAHMDDVDNQDDEISELATRTARLCDEKKAQLLAHLPDTDF